MRFPQEDDGFLEVGVDESGRGSVISAVVAGAVVMPPLSSLAAEDHAMYMQIRDSKKLSAAKRESLAEFIRDKAVAWGVGVIHEKEVDELNILNATYKAMHMAIKHCIATLPQSSTPPQDVRLAIDGNRFKPYADYKYECIVKGDDKVLSIAAASILAKTTHDKIIRDLVASDPDLYGKYDLISNMGYATAKHVAAIKQHGLTPAHRRSYTIKSLVP